VCIYIYIYIYIGLARSLNRWLLCPIRCCARQSTRSREIRPSVYIYIYIYIYIGLTRSLNHWPSCSIRCCAKQSTRSPETRPLLLPSEKLSRWLCRRHIYICIYVYIYIYIYIYFFGFEPSATLSFRCCARQSMRSRVIRPSLPPFARWRRWLCHRHSALTPTAHVCRRWTWQRCRTSSAQRYRYV